VDRYEAEAAAARSTRVYPWWAVVVPLVGLLVLLWWVALRPFAGMFAPDWQPASWHLLSVRGDTLLTAVEYADCDRPLVQDPEVQIEVVETPTEVRLDAYVAVPPRVFPGSCPQRYGVVPVPVALDAPLGGRTLTGCLREQAFFAAPATGCGDVPDDPG
jgi:hypothetical protein